MMVDAPKTVATIDELVAEITRVPLGVGHRRMIAIAGPPASGKTTLADVLCNAVSAALPGGCAVMPMDGFHYDDAVLHTRGHQDRKGAPHTFDLGGLASTLKRLRVNEEPDIAVAMFDRERELSRAAARLIDRNVETVIIEGNYLLLDAEGWRDLRDLFDLTVALQVERGTLEQRLVERWQHHGRDPIAARVWIDSNDLPNIDTVLSSSHPPDIVFSGARPREFISG